MFFWSAVNGYAVKRIPPGWPAGCCDVCLRLRADGLRSGLLFQCATDVEEIVGDDAEPDPTLHSGLALVAAAAEPVSPLDDTDASLASGPPFLAVAEPALLLFAFAAA
jgi:hypothetical protein